MALLVICFLLRLRDVFTCKSDFSLSVPGGVVLLLGEMWTMNPVVTESISSVLLKVCT